MRVNIFMTLIFFGTGLMNHPCYSGAFFSKPPAPGVKVEDNRGRGPAHAAPPSAVPVQQDPPPSVVVTPQAAPLDPHVQVLAATLQAALPPGQHSVTIHVHMAPPPSTPSLVAPIQPDVGPSTALAALPLVLTPSLESQRTRAVPVDPLALGHEESTKPIGPIPAVAASSADQPVDSARRDSSRSLISPPAAASSADQSPEDSRFQIVPIHKSFALILPRSLELRDQGRFQLALMPNICALYLYDSLSKADHPQFLDLNRTQPHLTDVKAISTAVQWVKHYLKYYGEAFVQHEGAAQLTEALERTIGSADPTTTKIKFGHDKANKKLIFSMEVTGGYVIFGKIPGHE